MGKQQQQAISQQLCEMNVREVWAFTRYPTKLKIPLYTSGVSAGFPSPAEDSLEGRLDLNRWLIDHPAATFCVRVEGDSMTRAHIHDGDVLVVDRMLEADDGDIIVARVGAEMCVKRLRIIEGQVWLYPESDNERFAPFPITEEMDFAVWGKVLHVIHSLKKEKSNGLHAVRH
jgi:DNA polymerase V